MVKCYKCEWEGKEEELVEKPGNLQFYDHVAANTMNMDVARSDYQCPRCGETLKTHRLIGGMVFDQ
jgi:C4-type Zn-finger protein